ncbi:MAG: hypothetical protein RLZZ40_797 [Actinomycetota bacterium]
MVAVVAYGHTVRMEIGRVVDLAHPKSFERLPELSTRILSPRDADGSTLTLEEIPLERFVGRGVIVDALGFHHGDTITYSAIDDQIANVVPGDIVLFHTGWDEYYGTPAYDENPIIEPAVIAALIVRGVLAVGIDAPRADPLGDGPGPVAHMLAAASGILCVNLRNLGQVDFPEPLISLVPGMPVNPTSSHVHASALAVN